MISHCQGVGAVGTKSAYIVPLAQLCLRLRAFFLSAKHSIAYIPHVITKKTEYAIRAMSELAADPEHLATANQIAQRQAIPPKYLPQIVSELTRAGLLMSVRGYGGGVRLSRPASEINILSIIEAMQGALTMFECQVGETDCVHHPDCRLLQVYCQAQAELERTFAETKLSDIPLHRQTRGSHAK
ncbi:MAG: Rrf2 family transcriptional regulator [Candidatus Zixiibacteriota bacterium]